MGSIIVYSEEKGVIEYDDSVPCVIARYLAFMNSEEFRAFATKTLEYSIKYKKPNEDLLFIADTTKSLVQPKADTDWAAANLNPIALKAGLKFSALLLPIDLFGERMVKNYVKATRSSDQDELSVDIFKSEEDAINWFNTIKNSELA